MKKVIVTLCWALALYGSLPCYADREHQVKAVYISNFIKFIEWADLGPSGSKFVVGVYGAEAYGHDINDALSGMEVAGHPVVVEQIKTDAEIKDCRLVLSGASNEERIAKLAKLCGTSGTVLVGDTPNFAKFGGTIGMALVSSRVRFDINLVTANKARVTISSRLLGFARAVFK